jgi:hypothetical protein
MRMVMKASSDIIAAGKVSGALALRGIEPELRSALEAEAARTGTSLNALILRILRESLGLSKAAGLCHDLDALAGVWSREEADEFTEAIRCFEEIDRSLWEPDPDAR